MTHTAPASPRFHHDGWTPDVRTAFLAKLAATGSVREAARACGKTPAAAYKLRAHANGAAFKADWLRAIGVCIEQVRETALDRAYNGQMMPILDHGVQIGEQRVFNDRLLIALLRLYDAPAYHAERALAAQLALQAVAKTPAELLVDCEAALEKAHRALVARDAEDAAMALEKAHRALVARDAEDAARELAEAVAAAAVGADLPVSNESPNRGDARETGVSNESPNRGDARETGVSNESPNMGDVRETGVSNESPNMGDARETGVSNQSPRPWQVAEPGVGSPRRQQPRSGSPTQPTFSSCHFPRSRRRAGSGNFYPLAGKHDIRRSFLSKQSASHSMPSSGIMGTRRAIGHRLQSGAEP